MKKYILSLIFSVLLFAFWPVIANAASAPSYPTCVNPQGNLRVTYNDGLHGIAGMLNEKYGSDKVYEITGTDSLMQCFCPTDGEGIQTNWWKAGNLTDDEIKVFKSQGWNYIADGSAWGLDNAQYLAINSTYNCRPVTTSNNTGSSSENKTEISSVNNPVQKFLNFASTGNTYFLYLLIFTGSALILTGLFIGYKDR